MWQTRKPRSTVLPARRREDWQRTTRGPSPAGSLSPPSIASVVPRIYKTHAQERQQPSRKVSNWRCRLKQRLTSVILPTTTSPTSPLNLQINTVIQWIIICPSEGKHTPVGLGDPYRVFSGLTQISLSTLCTSPATEAVSFSSSTYVPWPLRTEISWKCCTDERINEIQAKTTYLTNFTLTTV